MQTPWMRYVWALGALFVLGVIAVLLSMSISSQLTPTGFLEYAPANGPATITESYQAFNNNDLSGALASADAALAANPRDVAALLAKATFLAQKGSLEFKEEEYGLQAIVVAQQVLALDPNNAEAWRLIGYSNEIMQNYSAAHDAYAKASALDPENALTVSQEAHAYDLQGDMDRAEAGYRAALSLNPSLASAKLGLSRALMYRGSANEALELYESVADSPGNARQRAEAAYSAGQINEAMGTYAAAEARFRSATTIDPQYALGWTGLAIELFRQSTEENSGLTADRRSALLSESLTDLQTATTLNPNQSIAHYQLSIEMVAIGRSGDALIILKGLQKEIINNDITLSALGKTAMQQKGFRILIGTITAGSSAQ